MNALPTIAYFFLIYVSYGTHRKCGTPEFTYSLDNRVLATGEPPHTVLPLSHRGHYIVGIALWAQSTNCL